MDGTRKAHACFIFILNAVCIEVTEADGLEKAKACCGWPCAGLVVADPASARAGRGRGSAVMTDVQCVGALLFASQREAPRTYEADCDA